MNAKDYRLFTLEDFLSDDFFVASVKSPVRESVAFWQDFVASDPPNISEYFVARRYIESSNKILPFITDQEITRLWDNIAAETGLNKPKQFPRWKYVLYPAAVARRNLRIRLRINRFHCGQRGQADSVVRPDCGHHRQRGRDLLRRIENHRKPVGDSQGGVCQIQPAHHPARENVAADPVRRNQSMGQCEYAHRLSGGSYG